MAEYYITEINHTLDLLNADLSDYDILNINDLDNNGVFELYQKLNKEFYETF